uniref:Putative radical SAM superfamily protein n=1 Tax=viral metagenome TaxID=1070528 RepID=A0A6M3J394_9ZZZZ
MKVLLVNPHDTAQGTFSNAPLGIMYLASAIRDIAEVKISDGYVVGKAGIFKDIDDWNPDIVGITCYTPGRHKALEIAQYAKSKGCKTVLGGVHPSLMYLQMIEHYKFVDVFVKGEGEKAIVEIINDGIPGKNLYEELLIDNLDTIRFPAWDLVNLKAYPGGGNVVHKGIHLGQTRVPVIFSRGCTGNCIFCSTWKIWKTYRTRSPMNMANEIEQLVSMGFHHIVFEDDAMTVDLPKTKMMLSELIKRKLPIAFFATTKVESFDDELAFLLYEAGCYGISFGVESGSQEVLKRIGKTMLIEDTKRTVAQAKKAGLSVCALTMVGNPGETTQTINETISLLRELEVDEVGTIGCVWVLPGTALYNQCKHKGLINDDFWLGQEEVFVYKEQDFKPEWHGHVCMRTFL